MSNSLSPHMIKVVYVSHESESVLGSSRSLYNMIRSLSEEVSPIVCLPKTGPAYDFFTANGIKCVVIPYSLAITEDSGFKKSIKYLPRLLRDKIINGRALYRAKNILVHEQISLVHSNSSTVDWGYDLAKFLNLPHVWHLREFQDLDFNFEPYRGWEYLLRKIHLSNATISITSAIQKHFKLIDTHNAYCFFNAVKRISDIRVKKHKDSYFLLCGNLSRAKGLELALTSFSMFSKNTQGYKLLFIGPIELLYKTHIEQLALELGLEKSITFLPYSTNIDDYFFRATAFLMCSKNEAMGRVTVEAMFNGCPVIGFDGGGTKEIIQDGHNGLLFTTPYECAEAMQSVVKTNIGISLIEGGHRSAAKYFSEEAYRKDILKVYSSILNK
jgi:glycosyltransferase involved in cell wall biosynthesis